MSEKQKRLKEVASDINAGKVKAFMIVMGRKCQVISVNTETWQVRVCCGNDWPRTFWSWADDVVLVREEGKNE